MSTCGKCGSHLFKVQSNEPQGSAFVVYFVQCTSCGIPVGVLEYANSAALLEGIEKKIDSLSSSMQQIDYEVPNLKNAIRR